MKLKLIGLGSMLAAWAIGACGGMTAGSDGGIGAAAGDAGFGGESGQGGSTITPGGARPSFGGQPTDPAGGVGGSAACFYNGFAYFAGTSFLGADGCNTCYCEPDGQVSCTAMACVGSCSYNGVDVYEGESFPAGDGCNTCTCRAWDSMGTMGLACTEMACVGSCSYAGQIVANGTTFKSTDGLNKCNCSNGNVGCTTLAWDCSSTREYWRNYVAISPADCAVIAFDCPKGSGHFSNSCGCGCEQSPDCPQEFICVAGPGGLRADVAAGGAATAEMKMPASGGSWGAGGAAVGVDLPVQRCATAAERLACPLTPVQPILL